VVNFPSAGISPCDSPASLRPSALVLFPCPVGVGNGGFKELRSWDGVLSRGLDDKFILRVVKDYEASNHVPRNGMSLCEYVKSGRLSTQSRGMIMDHDIGFLPHKLHLHPTHPFPPGPKAKAHLTVLRQNGRLCSCRTQLLRESHVLPRLHYPFRIHNGSKSIRGDTHHIQLSGCSTWNPRASAIAQTPPLPKIGVRVRSFPVVSIPAISLTRLGTLTAAGTAGDRLEAIVGRPMPRR
jgi:hypothetical protein